jgi:hypothetical protein
MNNSPKLLASCFALLASFAIEQAPASSFSSPFPEKASRKAVSPYVIESQCGIHSQRDMISYGERVEQEYERWLFPIIESGAMQSFVEEKKKGCYDITLKWNAGAGGVKASSPPDPETKKAAPRQYSGPGQN